jgi:hypothetical protein
MSTPQNPNDPNTGQPNPNDPNSGQPNPNEPLPEGQPTPNEQLPESQGAGAGDQGQGQAQQAAYQQGTYDPNAYQSPSYQQGSYSQPGAYQQGAGQQQAYDQQAYGQPVYGQPAYGQAPQQAPAQAGFFKSLFDIRFDNFIAVKWAGFIYIIAMIVAALSYLGTIVAGISAGVVAGTTASYFNDGPSFNVLPLILSIVFGWIIPALWVIGVRLVLELIVSNIKTAENTKKIADSVSR